MSDKRSKSRAEFLKKQAREQALIQQRILEQQEREEQQRVNAAGSAGSGGDHVSTSLNNQLETQGLISNLLKTSSKRDRDGPDDNDGDVQDQEADSVAHRQQQQRREEFNHTIIQSAVGGGLSGKPSKYKANIIIEPSDTTQEDQTQQQTAQHEGGKPQPTAHVSKREALIASRAALPVGLVRSKILKTVEDNQICIIIGETGSGKTTQIPQFLHEAGYKKVVCTQPRRIAAISVAQRVAFEMDSRCGNLVGYKVRFDNKTSERTEVEFVTDGMMLKEMATDPDISDIGAIMIDEAHERSLATDILLGLLKDLCRRRKELKVIIASATVEAQKFSDFFWQAPILTVSGRTFDVEISYAADPLPDYPAAAAQMAVEVHLSRPLPGDILIFLTGQEDIERCEQQIHELMREQDQQRVRPVVTVPIYSALPPDDQQRIYQPPPENMRKIVIATNIAETSITVEDVVYVVDAGKIKQTTYDSQVGIATLTTVTAPKANGQQRRGRAGRCRPGVWYRLYSSWQWNDATPDSSVPEMLRTPMEELVLHVKSLELDFNKDRKCYDVAAVLREAIDPPEHQAVLRALRTLRNISAIDPRPPNAGGTEALTPLGSKLADMPMHPVLGKLVLYGALFGVLDPILTIAASLGYKSPFYLPMGEEAEANAAKAALAGQDTQLRSDHLLVVRAFDEWRSMPKGSRQQYSWCRKHYISQTTMTYIDSIREDIKRVVKDFRIDSFGVRADVTRSTISDSDDDYDIERIGLEEHSGKGKGGNGNDRRNHHQATDLTRIHQVVEAVLCSGLSPARVLSEKREPQLIVAETGRADAAVPHPGSLLGGPPPRRGEEEKRIGLTPHDHFVVYFTLQRTTKLFCYDCTAVPVLAMVLFAATADPIPPPSSDAEVTCLQLSKPLPLHLVQFQRAATCAQVLRLRELIHQRFLPAVIGRPLRPEHREAVLSLVDLLYKADETLQCASEDDDDDDDDDDGVKSSTSSAPKTQPSSVDGHFFSSTQNGGAGDRDGHGWSRGGSGSGTGGRGGGYRGRGGGYGGRGRDGRGGRGGNIH